jgi:hypothetical protein
MKKSFLFSSLFLFMLFGSGCSSATEDPSSFPAPTDNSTKRSIEELKNEEDKAMNFNTLPILNSNSPTTPLSVEEPNKNGSSFEGTISTQ